MWSTVVVSILDDRQHVTLRYFMLFHVTICYHMSSYHFMLCCVMVHTQVMLSVVVASILDYRLHSTLYQESEITVSKSENTVRAVHKRTHIPFASRMFRRFRRYPDSYLQ
jgi:NAD kinase